MRSKSSSVRLISSTTQSARLSVSRRDTYRRAKQSPGRRSRRTPIRLSRLEHLPLLGFQSSSSRFPRRERTLSLFPVRRNCSLNFRTTQEKRCRRRRRKSPRRQNSPSKSNHHPTRTRRQSAVSARGTSPSVRAHSLSVNRSRASSVSRRRRTRNNRPECDSSSRTRLQLSARAARSEVSTRGTTEAEGPPRSNLPRRSTSWSSSSSSSSSSRGTTRRRYTNNVFGFFESIHFGLKKETLQIP